MYAKRAMEPWLNQVEDDGSYGESYQYLVIHSPEQSVSKYAMR